MKAKLHKLIGTAVLGLALCLTGIPAWAGFTQRDEIQVTTTFAHGTMTGARYSTDSQQYIGCSFDNSNGPFVVCSARNKAGNSFICTSTNPKIAVAVKAMTDSSYLHFNMGAGKTSCDFLLVGNDSRGLR